MTIESQRWGQEEDIFCQYQSVITANVFALAFVAEFKIRPSELLLGFLIKLNNKN
jgi:hypothetical protein